MENHIQEIITKAIIGKGQKKTTQTHTLKLECFVEEALGCWIVNHHYRAFIEEDQVKVEGSYDLHLWYGYDHKKQSRVEVHTIHYLDEIEMKKYQNTLFCANDETRCVCLQEPHCIGAKVENGTIILTIEKQMSVSVIGEAMIKIETKSEDLDMHLDPNFIK